MSGFEAAGLVLGALSLVLEIYDECEAVTRLMVNYRKEYEMVRIQIGQLNLQYKYILEKMLHDIATAEERDQFMDNRWSGSFEDIESRLRHRFGAEDYRVYLDTMQLLSSRMQELIRNLVTNDRQPIMVALDNPLRVSRRMTFALTERTRHRLLKDIKGSLKCLRLLVTDYEDISVLRGKWMSRHRYNELTTLQRLFWQRAHFLQSAVLQTLKCLCSPTHCADLDLRHDRGQRRPTVILRDATSEAQQQPWSKLSPTFEWRNESELATIITPAPQQPPPRRTMAQRIFPLKKSLIL